MVGVTLSLLLPLVLVWCWWLLPPPSRQRDALYIVIAGYIARLAASNFVHAFQFFSYGNGEASDAGGYENYARVINRLWEFNGVHYVTSKELPNLTDTTLPANLFAFMHYLGGEPTHIGAMSVVAAAGGLTCLNIYALCHDFGCEPKPALWTLAAVTFMPTFFFYTADTYKDGLVACMVFGVFGSAIRLARRFSITQLAIGLLSLAALWFTRFYLVFIMALPLTVGLLGVRSKSFGRMAVTLLVLGIAAIAVVTYSSTLSEASASATRAYTAGTSNQGTAEGGSGVVIGGDGPGAFALKLAYSLFSPFPWQQGSIGLQVEKVEMIILYCVIHRMVKGARVMWARRPSDLLILTMFIAPTVAVYTISFSNVGLVVRERMSVMLTLILLAGLSWGDAAEDASDEVGAAATT